MTLRFRRVGSPGDRGLTLADVCMVLVVAALLLGSVLPRAICLAHDGGYRARCARNLRSIGQAIQMYAMENKGNLPRAVYDGAGGPPTEYTGVAAPDPFGPGGPGPNDVTAALFVLLRTQDITPEVFNCPGSQGERWNFGGKTAQQVSNFPSGKYLTYSYVNPYPTPAVVAQGLRFSYKLPADFAIAADINPGPPGVTAVTPKSPRKERAAANSTSHNGEGQNVLYADGHVEYSDTPFCGTQRGTTAAKGYRDNIYTFGPGFGTGAARVGVNGPPADPLDSILLPVGIFAHGAGGPAVPEEPSRFVVVGLAALAAVIVVVVAIFIRRAKAARATREG